MEAEFGQSLEQLRRDPQDSRTISHRTHCVGSVRNQIQKNVLKLVCIDF